jgi:hypothetical protein
MTKKRSERFGLSQKAIKSLITQLKPALTALAFFFVSSWSQGLFDKAPQTGSCIAMVGNVAANAKMSGYDLENKSVAVGARTLFITRHAAQRMVERGVSVKHIRQAVSVGKLFAYSHNGIIKIGYYHEAKQIFLAVDRHHEKIITAIARVPKEYVYRLLFEKYV